MAKKIKSPLKKIRNGALAFTMLAPFTQTAFAANEDNLRNN